MKNFVLNYLMKLVKKKNINYNTEQLAVVRYGLESIYILITKTIFIFLTAFLFGIFKEVLIFSLIYNLIKMPSFGLHATKSWICLVTSTLIFIIIPYLCHLYDINIYIRAFIGIISIILVFKNAPADTYKRPIINKKRRNRYKFISTIVSICMVAASLLIEDIFLHNSFIMALVVQCFMISPMIYSLFNLPYANYKNIQNAV